MTFFFFFGKCYDIKVAYTAVFVATVGPITLGLVVCVSLNSFLEGFGKRGPFNCQLKLVGSVVVSYKTLIFIEDMYILHYISTIYTQHSSA